MNPSVAVAFMTKMKLIFETDANGKPQDDTFLAFQNGAFAVGKDSFYFMEPAKHGLGPNETTQAMMSFDKTFNFVATVDDIITSAPDELDQVYYETLKGCQPASSTRTADQEARYQAALAYLQQPVTGPDGTSLSALDNYQRYADAYKAASSTYKNGRIAAESATGDGAAALEQAWQANEGALQQACAAALLNWETKGHRTEVEDHLGAFIALGGSSPRKTVADFQSDYELFGKSTALDPAGNEINYLPTQFSPTNFFDDSVPWLTISLDKTEINSLLQRASPHLKNLFQLGASSDIEHLTAEYAVVEILRNWFHFPDFVLQRYWKQAPGAPPLADGQGHGRLPAFPAKLVFIRNVRIVAPRADQVAATATPTRFSNLLFASAQPAGAQLLQAKAATFQAKELATQKLVGSFRLRQVKLAISPAASLPIGGRPLLISQEAHPEDQPGREQPVRHLGGGGRVVARPSVVLPRPVVRTPAVVVVPHVPLPPPRVVVPLSPPLPAAPPLETTSYPTMELLGFVCRKLPPCPNPDLSLNWS